MNQLSGEARLSARLQELRAELARGETQLAELDQRRAAMRDTLLRISGAVQVLQELLEQHPALPDLFRAQSAPDALESAPAPVEMVSPLPGVPE